MSVQIIGGELFNVDAIQRLIGRAKRSAYPEERSLIEVIERLISAYRREVQALSLEVRSHKVAAERYNDFVHELVERFRG